MTEKIPRNRATAERWVLVLSAIASLMVALDALVVSTALSAIHRHLGASISELEWTVNAYGLSFAVLLITGSAVGDRLGRRRMFAAGLGLFVAASAACALAPSVGWLIAARAVQGAGAALVAPLSLSLLSATFPPERRGRALGIYSGITGIAVLGGPVIGGAVTQGLAWQWIFWLNVPIGLIAIPLVLSRMPESFGPRGRFDTRGLALVTAGAFGIVWALIRGNVAGWGSAEVLATLVGGIALIVAFVAVELRSRHPMLPMRLFASRGFAAGNAATFLLAASLFSAVFFMAQYQQVSLGQGPLDAGLRLLPWTATLFVVAPIAGALTGRVGERVLVATGLLLVAVGMAWIALIAAPGLAYWKLVAPLIIAGAGVSMAIPAAQTAIMGAVAPADLGRASGISTMMRQLGGVFGLAVAASVFAGSGSYASPVAFGDGFAPAIAVSAACALAGAIAGSALPRRRRAGAAAAASAAGQQLTQRPHPVPDIEKPRGQWGEAEADHVGTAEVGNHPALDQLSA
jgi:EmrB/QacA subfamily drug resistance transporter